MEKILIVVDMQNDFISGALGTKEAQAIVESAALKIKEFDGDIIVTYDTHYENYMDTAEGKLLPVPHCIHGTVGWELNTQIKDALSNKKYNQIEKLTFGSVDLPLYIKDNYDVENLSIELIGLCTDICVVSNALILKANFPEAKISAHSQCMAGVTPEKHIAALNVMESCQINII